MTDYHKLPIAKKRSHARLAMRAGPTRCPVCETAVQPRDLLAHVEERCPGRPEPHPTDDWVSWAEALELGAADASLVRWVEQGRVRTSGESGSKRYLLRDLAACLAALSSTSKSGVSKRRRQIGLTKRRRRDPRTHMEPLNETLIDKIKEVAAHAGGIEAASRRLDVPAKTLRKAVAGARLRRGTRLHIERQLDEGGNE